MQGLDALLPAEIARKAETIGAQKTRLDAPSLLVLAVLAGAFVGLGAMFATTSDKILAVIFPVSAFVAAGFEHSVANMYFVPLGLFVKMWAPSTIWSHVPGNSEAYAALTWTGFFLNLVPVTVGNIVGGGGLVGAVYWFIYLRAGKPQKAPSSSQ